MPGRSSPSPFPHIGNVGANREDIETQTPAARGLVLRADITEPSNWRAAQHLDAWLEAQWLVGIAGRRHAAADAAHPRRRRAQRRALPRARRQASISTRCATQARGWPGLEGMDLAKEVTLPPDLCLGRDRLALGPGLRPARAAALQGRRRRLRRQAQHPAHARRHRRCASRWCRRRPAPRTFCATSPTAFSSPTARAIRPRPANMRCRCCRQLIGDRQADLRHLPRPSAPGAGARRQDQENGDRPSRRQSSGQGPRHRQGRDHQPESRLRRAAGDRCRATPR